MNKFKIVAVFVVLLSAATIALFFLRNNQQQIVQPQIIQASTQPVTESKVGDLALKNALNLYASAKASNRDLTSGPCLGLVAPDWVLDIVHHPRQSQDEKSQNQCPELASGQAHHFIELDENGQLIRMQ